MFSFGHEHTEKVYLTRCFLPTLSSQKPFLCMLAYYVEWQLRQKLAPLLFAEEDRKGSEQEREDIVSPAVPSDATRKKACTRRTSKDLPGQAFGELLENPGAFVKKVMQAGGDEARRRALP